MAPKQLEKLPPLSPAEFEATLNEAAMLHESGKLIEAHHLYRELLKQQPMHARALFLKSIVLYQMDRVDEALPFIQQALKLDALNPDILNGYGLIMRSMRNFEAALKAFEEVVKLRPDFYEAVNNIGLVYGDVGNREVAIPYFKRALELKPDSPDVMLNLAHCLRDDGQPQEALPYYQKLAQMYPDSVRHVFNLAIILHTLEQFDEATVQLKKVLELDPNNVDAGHLLKAVQGDKTAENVPDPYIADLFDNYAKDFDLHLASLQYEVPKMLAARIPHVVGPKAKAGQWRMLDLGCGTGACGVYFNEHCSHMVGVDLSSKMVELARSHGIYDELYTISIDDYYAKGAEPFDLIFATDVLVYIGALENFMAESAKHLKPGGLLAVSTELCTPEEGDYVLRNSGRFAQSDPYMLKLAKENGLTKLINADITVRMGQQEPIPGKLYILKK